MTAGEFLRRLKALGKRSSVAVRFDPAHGKGSHGTVYYGGAFTRLKDLKKEVGKGLLAQMCADLGIYPRDL